MILSEKQKTKFEPCPEYTGRGVCVDVTPLKTVETAFGVKDKFRIVFEVDMTREDGSLWCVWSTGFNATLHEKGALRKFLKQWLGRDLTDQERVEFETDSLVGKSAFLVVSHNQGEDGTIYANIAACTPLKGLEPLKPSGKYIRVKDRQNAVYQAVTAAPTLTVPKIGRPSDSIMEPVTEFNDLLVCLEDKVGTSVNGPWKATFCTFNNREERPATMDKYLAANAAVLVGKDVRVKMQPGRKPNTWELLGIWLIEENDDIPM